MGWRDVGRYGRRSFARQKGSRHVAQSYNHPGPLDPRWELVETGNATGRMLYARRPLVGSVFGPLTVVRSDAGNNGTADCTCACGSSRTIAVRQLWRGQSLRCKQCAALAQAQRQQRDADIIPDPELRRAWAARYKTLVRRCLDPADPAFCNYGARGITVFDQWVRDRRAFFQHATTLPRWDEPGLDLDRAYNDQGYEPGNLRLVTRVVNANNKRNNRIVEFRGREFTVAQFWRRHCPEWRTQSAVAYHLNQGRTPEWIVAKHDEGRRGVRSPELRVE